MKIVVVGAGLVGTAVARSLALAGASVTVVERGVPGAEASWAAGGILSPQAECDEDGPFLRLCLDGLAATTRLVDELKDQLGLAVPVIKGGTLDVAFDEAEAKALRARVAWQANAGLDAVWLERDDVRRVASIVDGDDVVGAAYFAGESSLDPRILFEALRGSAQKAGATLVRRTVTSVKADAVVVDHDDVREVLHADAVVVCACAWTPHVDGAGVGADVVFPVKGQMIELLHAPGAFTPVIYGRGGYIVPRQDGRIVAGSTMERAGFDKGITVSGMQKVTSMVQALAPALSTTPIRHSWAGLRPGTVDGLPLLGQHDNGVWVASGHFRNGVLLAAISGERLASAMLDESDKAAAAALVPFSPRRFSRG